MWGLLPCIGSLPTSENGAMEAAKEVLTPLYQVSAVRFLYWLRSPFQQYLRSAHHLALKC